MVVSAAAARTAAAAQQRATTTKTRANRFEAPVTSGKQGMEARRLPLVLCCVAVDRGKGGCVDRVVVWVCMHACISDPCPTESYYACLGRTPEDLKRPLLLSSNNQQPNNGSQQTHNIHSISTDPLIRRTQFPSLRAPHRQGPHQSKMMNRLICGCLRDRQALKHRRHTPEEAHGGVAHLSDDDEMAVVELPPLPTATVVRPPASAVAAVSKSKPAPVPVASTSKPAAAGEEDLLTGLRPSPPPVAATAPPQQPASLQQQQHKSTPTKAGPVPTSAAPSPRSPAAPASPAPPSPAPSPRSPGPEEAASPLRLPSRTVHASPTPAPAPGVLSPATSISTIKPPSATNANWAEAWAPMVRERQQAYTQEKAKQEIVAALGKGIAALKHDRKGHARVRELYTPDGGQSFSWRSPHKEKAGHGRGKSSAGAGGGGGAGMFERGRAVYAFHEILEVG